VAGELQPERRRLGVDAVRPPDAERVAVLVRPGGDGVERAVDAGEQQPPGLLDLERERRVDDVGGGEAVVEPASLLAQLGGHGVDEGGGVVVRPSLQLRDTLGGRRRRALADRRDRVRRDGARLGPALQRGQLDVEPAGELALVRPDGRHGRAGVARDHVA
jgi:hypothetical protein